MYTLDDIKTDRDAQITVGLIAFFLVAFPAYFAYASAFKADDSLGGGVADYQINGEIEYLTFESNTESIAEGDPLTVIFNTDDINNVEELNIVGVRLKLSFGEDETSTTACASDNAADTVSGTITHLNNSATDSGDNQGGSGEFDFSAVWFDEALYGQEVITNLTMAEIEAGMDGNGVGVGEYTLMIEVDAETGSSPLDAPVLCQRSDGGEEVTYTVDLMVLDYTVVPYFDTSDI